MKKFKSIVALLLAMIMIFATACATNPADDPVETEPQVEEESKAPETPEKTEETPKTYYNVIFALATIPPVLSALEAIDNGYPTYAIIERGKTYSGIDDIENFYNVGFDPANNLSEGFTATEFNAMVSKVKELNNGTENAFFNFYVQDGTALMGAAISANAGLKLDQFHITMCEDGTGAYDALYDTYLKNRTLTPECDGVYAYYASKVEEAKAEFNAIMGRTDNNIGDGLFSYNIGKAYALAALDNFTYYIQDEEIIVNYIKNTKYFGNKGDVETKLLSAFGVEGYEEEVGYTLNLKYGNISDAVAKLSETKRIDYIKLMYGQYYEDTYSALTRTERAGETAPSKKLVYIGTRHNGYAHFASGDYGIGAINTVPADYDHLDSKYKTAMLFPSAADYNVFLDAINDASNYEGDVSDEVKVKVATACFNNYIDYIFNLKFIYKLYGADYDIIMKGHPREVIGSYEEWGNKYKVSYGEDQSYYYDKLMDQVLLGFHESDSVGKYIGMVPYGTAAENLAYLGANIAIGGLPSSTYTGYDRTVDVVFITCETNEDITGTASTVADRYNAGDLLYTNKNGESVTAEYYNIGNVYKALIAIYTDKDNGDTVSAAAYTQRFNEWLAANRAGATDIDGQGFAITAS